MYLNFLARLSPGFMPCRILRLAENTYDRNHRMRWHKIDHVLFHRQRADIVSQLRAMRADVMHGQNIKHCGYTPDIRIRLNNPELSEAVVPDCFQIFFSLRCQLNLFHLPPWP